MITLGDEPASHPTRSDHTPAGAPPITATSDANPLTVRTADGLALHARRSAPRLGPGRALEPVVDGARREPSAAQRALATADGGGRAIGGRAGAERDTGWRRWRGRGRDEHTGVADYLDALTGAHRVPLTVARAPGSAHPASASADAAPTGIVDRLAAALAPRQDTPPPDAPRDVDPTVLAEAWAALADHDPAAVTARVDLALPAGGLPATTLDVRPGEVTVAVGLQPVDELVGPRTPVTEAGGLRLKRADPARKHAVYARIVDATVLAVTGTVLAVVPAAASVTVVVLCPEHLGGPAALLVARCDRERVLPAGASRVAAERLADAVADPVGDLAIDRGETLGALRPLGTEVDGVDALVRAVVLHR